MNCKFIYKNGRVFKSELDFDEYLINALKYNDIITDETFSYSTEQRGNFEKIINVVKTNRDIIKYSKLEDILINPDSEIYSDYEKFMPKGTIPVTGALKEYRDENDNRAFAEFIAENYWKEMIIKWQSLDYWHDTSKEGPSQDFITAVFGNDEKYKNRKNITSVPTADMMTRGRHIITNAWAMQGFIGSGIHRMFKVYWDSLYNSIKGDETKTKEAMLAALKNYDLVKSDDIPEELKKFKGIKLSDIIDPNLVDRAFDICVQLRKRIEQELNIQPGEELSILAEIPMVSNFNSEDTPNESINLVGSLDLVVIDPKGNIHIFDYKTSPHPYSKFDPQKKLTFKYQLATYQRMLEQRGFDMSNSNLYVIPVQFVNFRFNWIEEPDKNPTDVVSFDSFKLNEFENVLVKLQLDERVKNNMDVFLPIPNQKPFKEGEILQNVQDFMDNKFPVFDKSEEVTDKEIVKKLNKKGEDKLDKNGKFKHWQNGELLKADSLEELIEKIKNQNSKLGEQRLTRDRTKYIKNILKRTQNPENDNDENFDPKEIKSSVVSNILERYANLDYELVDGYDEQLESLGIILVQNKHSKRIDVLICDTSTKYLTTEILLNGNRETLTGTFISDIAAKNKQNSQVMESTHGNIKLMQTMAALNQIPSTFINGIGEVTIFNTIHNEAISAPNSQLLYNFNQLCSLDKKNQTQNNFIDSSNKKEGDKKIEMKDYLSVVRSRAVEILVNPSNNRKWGGIKDSLDLTEELNPVDMRNKLEELAEKIEDYFNLKNVTKIEGLRDYQIEPYKFLAQINFAIAELSGVTFRQQLMDHSKYLNQNGLFGVLTKGWSANMLDNPGMLDSDTLNLIGTQLNVAYQNIRDEMQSVQKKLDELDQKLKDIKGFGYLKSRTIGNETSLYRNMYDETYDEDLVFKNPFDPNVKNLDETEREYLKFALLQINNNRIGHPITLNVLEKILTESDEQTKLKYLRVPLMTGSTASKMTYKGIGQTIKEKLFSLVPGTPEFKRAFNEKMNHIFTDSELFKDVDENTTDNLQADFVKSTKKHNKELWYMSSIFDYNENEEHRLHNIEKNGIGYYERNLSVLIGEHTFSYSLKKHINKVFPILKACAFKLEMEGALLDDKFVEDLDYLHKFITAKVLNKSIEDPKWRGISYITGEVMQVASKLALGFNPKQLYQAIDGLFKDISLVCRNPDGSEVFTAKNFRDSFIWAYQELARFGDEKSLIRRLNELYGINDMDMNQYAKKIRPNQYGIFNFDNLLFHFASRPDFYNRMTIFGAKMRADGCFEAHDAQGNYDWTKDKRYSIFAKYIGKEKEIPNNLRKEYEKQKALYIITAEQFQAENAKIEINGQMVDFKVNLENPIPLPRAYTVREAESIKSMADLVYGYYSHEKKSLIQSTTAGAAFMQMNTYWSSKKNQWMAPGGIRMLGRWEQLVEESDGEKYVYYEDENGCPTTIDTGIPYIVWRGQYQEGILVTLAKILEIAKTENGWTAIFNPIKIHDARVKLLSESDSNMRTAYRNNIKQFWIDLLAYLILGLFISKQLRGAAINYAKETGNDTFGKAVANTSMILGASMLQSACLDFNALDSIIGRATNTNLFALKILEQSVEKISIGVSGNRDLYDTLILIPSASRTLYPVLDYQKQITLGRSIGDNGKSDE